MRKRGHRSKYNEAQWAWVTGKYRQGYSVRQLAAFLGMGSTSVFTQICKRMDGTVRNNGQPLDRDAFEKLGGTEA